MLILQIALECRQPWGEGSKGRHVYKPIFLAAPQNLIRQWARELLFEWLEFELVISHDDSALETYLAERVVSSTTVRAWPDAELWSNRFDYMLDGQDPRNARTMFLTRPKNACGAVPQET